MNGYRESHREEIRSKGRQYQKNNRAQYAANTARYKASKIKATPDWLTEDHKTFMDVTYAMAGVITKMTGVKHVVDHIHPLRGKSFSGLHVPWNLQVITEPENLEKSNKLLEL
jgi:5-methylcytosine-specific restriction endonuclease McrA